MAIGKVYLIGAGPGDVELLTLKAVRLLKEADVILLDDLVNPAVLDFAKLSAEVIHVGKRAGCKSTPQLFISKLMITFAYEGKCVARVKGGDPLIFGRCGEELEELRCAGIDVEIVNGVSAGLAASAALGISLSHRDYAHSITFVTGRSREGGQPNWQALAQSDSTLVIYMGMKTLPYIVEQLMDAGMSPEIQAAVVQNVTLPNERFIITTLGQVIRAVPENDLGSPAIIVVGKVLELAGVRSTLVALEASRRIHA